MKVGKENFNKLPQLDRIEYLTKLNLIWNYFQSNLVILITVILCFAIVHYLFQKILLTPVMIIWFFHTFNLIKKQKEKLQNEYFKLEVSKK